MKRLSEYLRTICCFNCDEPYKRPTRITMTTHNYEVIAVCSKCRTADLLRINRGEFGDVESDEKMIFESEAPHA